MDAQPSSPSVASLVVSVTGLLLVRWFDPRLAPAYRETGRRFTQSP